MIDMLISGGMSAGLGAGLSIASKVVNWKIQQQKLNMTRNKEEMELVLNSQNAAMDRDPSVEGQWIRRFIVVTLFSFVTYLLWITGLISYFVEGASPTTYAYMEEIPSRWFGFLRARSVLRTVALTGVPVFDTTVNMCWLIGTFYFGSSRIK